MQCNVCNGMVCMYVHMCIIYIMIYIYILCVYVYIIIYIYTHMDVHMSHFIHIFLGKIAPSAAVAVQCSKGRDAHPDPAGHLWIHG